MEVMMDSYNVRIMAAGKELSKEELEEVARYIKMFNWKAMLTEFVVQAIEQFPDQVNGKISVEVS